MTVEFKRRATFHLVRLIADKEIEADVEVIKESIEKGLQAGIKHFIFSASTATVYNRVVVSRLLRWCKKKILPAEGKLLFYELDSGEGRFLETVCKSLEVPMFRNSADGIFHNT